MNYQEDWDRLPTIETVKDEEEEWESLSTIETVRAKEEKYGLGYVLKETLKGTGKGLAEVAGTVMTGLPGFALGFVGKPAYGLYKQWKEGFKDVQKPWELITKTFEKGKPAEEFFHAGIYQPEDPTAQKTLKGMFYPFAKFDEAVDWVKKSVTDDPATQETIDWLGDLTLIFGISAGTSMIKGAFRAKVPPKISTLKKILLESEKVPDKTKAIIEAIPDKPLKGELPEKLKALEAFEKYYEKADVELAQLGKIPKGEKIKRAYQTLKRTGVDTSANIKRNLIKDFGELGKEAVIRHDLIRGASKRSQYYVSRVIDEVFADLKPEQRKLVWEYIQTKRVSEVLDYKPKHKFPPEFSAEKNKFLIESIEKKLPDVADRAEAYFDIFREKLLEMHDEGLISRKSFENLSKHAPYEPIRHIEYIDPQVTVTRAGKKITVPDSGIKALKKGSESIMEYNAELLLGEYITRIDARIMKNRANKALYDLAEAVPDNGLATKAKIIRTTKKGKPVFQRTPTGQESITVMVDGKPKKMFMPENMASEWILSDPMLTTQQANVIGLLSGSKILKPMATGLNPEFALTNFPRDIAHIFLVTNEYSPQVPKFLPQMGMDLLATMGDAFFRKGKYLDYINEGGGMQFLTHQGRITTKVGGKLGQLQEILGYVGETSEIWTRLALRERSIKKGRPPHHATWEARNYLDFSQGGSIAKAIDSGVPYLNAGIQGTRGIFRAFADRPAQTTYKVAQIGALSTGLYLANYYGNPEALKSISQRDQANNFCIPIGLDFKDKSGNKRHLFIKLAKDQGQRFFCTLFDGLMKKALGHPVDGSQVYMSLADAFPIIPTQNIPPTMDALLGYALNKDFWTREDIWRGPATGEMSPERRNEYNKYTHPALIEIGKYTGASPERLNYALQQYFTYGNIYTSITGEGIRALMGKLPEEHRDKTKEQILLSLPFIRRVAEATDPYEPYRKDIQQEKEKKAMYRYHQTEQFDMMLDTYYRKLEETGMRDDTMKGEILKHIKAQPQVEQSRLYDRFHSFPKLFHLPDRRWWLQLMSSDPELRAHFFYVRWKDLNNEEKKKLQGGLNRVPGVFTQRFKQQLLSIMRKENLKWAK